MRNAWWCLLGISAATAATAQETQVSFAEPQPVTVTGFAVGQAGYDRALKANGFTAGKMALSLFKPVGDAYFFGQLTTALDDNGASSTAIDNLIVSWTPAGANRWSLVFGRFDAPLGVERDDEPLNFLPTSSFTFELARPIKFTGVAARLTASPKLEVTAIAANGWNADPDNNRGKTGELRVQWLPTERVTLAATGTYGPERDSTDAHQRALLSGDLTVDADCFVVGIEAHAGREQQAGSALQWNAVAATGFWKVTNRVGLAARYDRVADSRGVLTGTGQTLESFTVGPMWYFSSAQEGIFTTIEHTRFRLPQVAVRAALRFDHSTQPFFAAAAGGLRSTDTRAVVELVYLF
jgi:hypothetical protein